MQQPLSHLYFITVFHHLLSNNFDIAGLVRVASAIATVIKINQIQCNDPMQCKCMEKPLYLNCCFFFLLFIPQNLQDGGSKEQQVLLYIEQQAVIQAVIQQLAKNLNPAKPNCISNVSTHALWTGCFQSRGKLS